MPKNKKRAHALALIITDKLVQLDPEKGLETAALECYKVYSEAYRHSLFILNTKEGEEGAGDFDE